MLSVTATRSAELFKYHIGNTKENWSFVYLVPGKNYYGPNEFNDLGLIKKCERISNILFWIQELASFKRSRKYIIIRAGANKISYIKEIARRCGFRFDECNSHSELKIRDLDTRPSETTIIHIKGMLRMGKEMKRENVCAVIETTSKNHDTLFQGLLGRCSGYYTNDPDIVCYIPKQCFDTKSLEEYRRYTEQKGNVNMTHTKHVKGNTQTRKIREDPYTGTKIIHLRPLSYNSRDYNPLMDINSDDRGTRFRASIQACREKIELMVRTGQLQ